MPLLEIKNLDAFYGKTRALHRIGLTLETGEIIAILGANGAGKTTTLRAICGMNSVTGEIHFAGNRIEGWRTEAIARAGIAHVPEGRGAFTRLTVRENLRLGAYSRRDAAGIRKDMERMYDYFPPLAARRDQQAGALSGGEQQMLAIARALMPRPRLMLLDEPSFGLAPKITRKLFEILRAINAKEKVGMLLVEQNAALALKLADYAYLLETGEIVLAGPAREVASDEKVIRSYLGY
uniref:Amino acid/amide ABC transporter ATP-binding protein 2, HAAT family n=1 Tax=Candidatus Kentrum sp. TC TaxID=2126339 RepID=A0A450YLR7_9GAMM|nr:MAG: amino acid/amide ABC transporter ATP-binding protein 2, HAAT family [Candidatus Kentron sp. TC]